MAFIGNNPRFNTGTFRPQSADPSNPTEGMVFYADGTSRPEGLYQYKNNNWVLVGSGGAGVSLNFYENGDADSAQASDFSTGNNATFDGGGSLVGTFAKSTTAADLISGTSVFKYTQASGSLNDYIASPAISIPQGYRGRELQVKFQYKYSGDDNDMQWVVEDNTNTNLISVDLMEESSGSNNIAKQFVLSFFCPSDCQEIKIGPQVAVENIGAILIWDDVVVSPDIVNYQDLTAIQEVTQALDGDYTGGTAVIRRQGKLVTVKVTGITHASDANPQTSAGFLPTWATPDDSFFDHTYIDASTFQRVTIKNTGEIQTLYFNASSSPTNLTNGANFNVSYIVDSNEETNQNIVSATDSVHPALYNSTDTSNIATNTFTILDFDVEESDSDNLVAGAGSGPVTTSGTGWRYISPRKGTISVSSGLQLTSSTGWSIGERLILRINVNGVESKRAFKELSGATDGSFIMSGQISALLEVNKGDIVELELFQDTGGNAALSGSGPQNFISIHYVDKAALAAVPSQTRYQTKTLSSNVTSTGNVADLQFDNLTVGKHYRVSLTAFLRTLTSTGAASIAIQHNSNTLGTALFTSPSATTNAATITTTTVVFQAQATTVTFNATNASATEPIAGNGTQEQTFAQLEELPNHHQVNIF
jgi:hypothetical protein